MGALCGVPGVFRSCLLGPTPPRRSLHECRDLFRPDTGTTNAPSDGWRLAVLRSAGGSSSGWGLVQMRSNTSEPPSWTRLETNVGAGFFARVLPISHGLQTGGRHTAGDKPAAGRATACHCKGKNAGQTVTTYCVVFRITSMLNLVTEAETLATVPECP